VGFNDLWVCNMYFAVVWSTAKATPFYGYFPIDARGLEPRLVGHLHRWAGVATYAEFGRTVLRDAGYDGPCAVIPHGVDQHPPAKSLRDSMPPEVRDGWLVVRADINRRRKRYDLAISAFCEFSKGKPLPRDGGPVLWLHCADYGDDLPVRQWYEQELAKTGQRFEDRPLLRSQTQGHNLHPYASDEFLRRLYATADCYLQTTDAEGWGLCAVEASQQGAVVVAGAHSVHSELWGGAAVLLEPVGWRAETIGLFALGAEGKPSQVRTAVEYPVFTHHAYVAGLEMAYSDRPFAEHLKGNAATRWAEPRFQWTTIEGQFREWVGIGHPNPNATPATPCRLPLLT
jgi:hypothetical protein